MKHGKKQAALRLLSFVVIGLCQGGSAPAQTWTITTIDATGDVGRSADLRIDPGGDLHVVYLRNDDHTLKEISQADGVWSAPAVVDDSGQIGGSCALWLDASDRIKTAYRRTDLGAAMYAGPEGVRTWTAQAIVQTDDVGRNLSMLQHTNGDLGLAYKDQTTGALHHVSREGGIWGTPVIVDPGPNRGQHFDIAYDAGDGYCFPEYDAANGAVLIAHTRLRARSFTIQPATSQADDVGRSLTLLQDPDGSMTATFRNQTRGSLQYIRREGGTWTDPTTVDPGPGRGQSIDATRRPGVGLAFCEYDATNGAQLLADPVLQARPWTLSPITSGDDDVGRGLSLLMRADGSLAASYRNATQGSLQHIRREAGAWTDPVTVDPGPNRGQYSDLAEQPDGGFCFAEYEAALGAALLAHSTLQGRTFAVERIDGVQNAGRQLSLFPRPEGRLDCAYVTEETGGRLKLKVAEIVPGYAFIVRTVADSVSMTADGAVTPDLFVTPDLGWRVSYRKVGPNDLTMASTENFQLLPADAAEPADQGAAGVGVASRLAGSYPNPAAGGFRVRFTASSACAGEFHLLDVNGRVIRHERVDCTRGVNEFRFDGRTGSGEAVRPGVYFFRLTVGGRNLGERKVIFLDRGR